MNRVQARYVISNIVEPSTASGPTVQLEHVGSGNASLVSDPPILPPDGNNSFQPGDVLFGKLRPYLAKTLLVSEPLQGTGEFLCLRPTKSLSSRFLKYITLSRPWLEHAEQSSHGTKMPRTSWDQMSSFEVPDISIRNQRRIADFLDDRVTRIDKIIAARQQQRLRNEEILCSLENKLTTIGSGDTRSTCIEWMPEISSEYELWRISRVFSTASGTTPRSDSSMYYGSGTPWITTSDLRDKIISLIPHSVTDESFRDYSALKKFPSGTLIVAMYGATVGRLGILESPAATNQACCAMLPSGPVDVWYAFHWFHAHRSHIMALASGGGQPNISQDLVRSLSIPAPNIKKQKEIVDILSGYQEDLREADDALIRQIDLLQEYKQSLITAAVNGEFDVTAASTKVPG